MKRMISITGIGLVALFYCFATYRIIKDSDTLVIINQYKNVGDEKSAYHSSFGTFHFCYIPKNEVSLNSFQNSSDLNLKNQFSGFFFFIKSEEIKIRTEYIQNVSKILKALIRNRKTDIIFPFHYFW